MKIGDNITLKQGRRVGMKALKADTLATVVGVHNREDKTEFYTVSYLDRKGTEKYTSIDSKEATI